MNRRFNKYFWKNTEAYIDEHYDDQYEAKYINKDGKVVESGSTKAIFESPKEEYTRELLAAIPVCNI